MISFKNYDFFGREEEVDELELLYNRAGFKLAIVYGRRRVGKSSVIQKFIQNSDKPSISFMALEQSGNQNLESFSQCVFAKYGAAKSYLSSFSTWENAFDYIVKESAGEKLVLFIDEYPYLAAGNKSISSIIQKYADGAFRATNILLVLCGSSMSFMENQVLGAKSPLYGRRDMQFKIQPFDYFESAKFFEGYSNIDKALVYAVAGGIPLYLNLIRQHGKLADGIKNEFLKKNGYLYEEPRNLLLQELREPSIYNAIIRAIATGSSKASEIASKAGENVAKISKYLSVLINLHLVKKEMPIIGANTRNGIYRLCDNMFRFYYRFVIDSIMNIEGGMKDYVYSKKVLPLLPDYMGHIFEDICIQYMKRQNALTALPFVFDNIGRFWGNNPILKREEEIDIIAYSGKSAIFGECKWSDSVGTSVLTKLQEKSQMFAQFTKKYYYIFSKDGFTDDLLQQAQSTPTIKLIDLNTLYA